MRLARVFTTRDRVSPDERAGGGRVQRVTAPLWMTSLLNLLRATPRRRWWTTFVLMGALAGIWALTTPLFGVPDEPAHVIRAAAIVRGDVLGKPRKGEPDLVRYVSVPAIFGSVTIPYVGDPHLTTVCFAFNRNVTPACLSFSGSEKLKPVATQVAHYPPLYYGIAGAASLGMGSVRGVLLMRGATVLLCAALVAWAYWSTRRAPNPAPAMFGLILAITPTALFLFGSVNPSALEIAAGIALWAAGGMLVLEAPSRIDRRLVAATGVSATLLMLSRSPSPLWVALIAVALAVFAPAGALGRLARNRTCRVWAVVVAVAAGVEAAWTVAFDALGKQGGTGVHASASELLRTAFGKSTATYEQMIGVFGWVDTPAPFLTFLLWTMMLGGLIGLALVAGRRRQCVALIGLLGAVTLVPPVIEAAKAHEMGFTWQGRYTMPLAVGVPILAGLTVATGKRRNHSLYRTRPALLATMALFIAHFVAYVQNLRRNMVGYDGPITFWRHPEWSPLLPAWLLTAAYALALAGLLLWLLSLIAPYGATQSPRNSTGSSPSAEKTDASATAGSASA
jgi:predicted membrane protein DUF2142